MTGAIAFDAFHARLGRPERILVLAPHPDDETCGCGGLLAMAAAAGVRIDVVLLTDGTASHRASDSHPPARLAALRRAEMARALRRLNCRARPVRLGLPDGDCELLSATDLAPARRRLERVLRRAAPDLILAPWRRDPHGDHRAGAVIARRAAVRAAPRARLAEYDVWTALTGEPGDQPRPGEVDPVALDVRPVLSAKRRALAAHASQLGRRITDDPDGFAFTRAQRRALLSPVERYFL
ncbi:MAG: PIG-L deacetylase family protein [Oceanicaulis sp.]